MDVCFPPRTGFWSTVRAGLSVFLVFFLPLALFLVVLATLLSLSVTLVDLMELVVLME